MHGRLTYANVAATLALVFAMSGGALAANHYLINSTKQINPKVLKKLRGARGAGGATGQRGATGAGGPAGKAGAPGKEGTPGKEGIPGKEGQPGASASASIATAFAQVTPVSPISLEEADTLVLSTKSSGKNLALPAAGAHVLAQASVGVANSEVSAVKITCQLAWEALAGGGPHLIGNPGIVELQGTFVTRTELPLTANVSLVGGETYALQVYCHTQFGASNGRVLAAAINAVGPD
jgi:Collagen triple helix repeat (20 copies)